jgi:hypothetical protein
MTELAVDTAAPVGATPPEADPRVPPSWRSALTDELTMTGRSAAAVRRVRCLDDGGVAFVIGFRPSAGPARPRRPRRPGASAS